MKYGGKIELTDVAEWPATAQWLVWLLLGAVLCAVTYVWRIEPRQRELEAVSREQVSLAEKLSALPQVRTALTTAQGNYARLSARHQTLLGQLPARRDLAPLLAQISRLGTLYQVTLTRLEWQEEKDSETLIRVPLELEARAEYADLQAFIDAAAQLSFVINLEDARWQRSDPQQSRLLFHARGYTYLVREGQTDEH